MRRAARSRIAALLSGAALAACVPRAAEAQVLADCFPAVPGDGPGTIDPFQPTRPEAARLNLAGKRAYRQGLWAEARQSYRAAEQADADFLSPALNVACSFVRQERFAEATAEVIRLVERAYVPWHDEILAAADIGALKVRPEWATIETAFARSRQRWAGGLAESVLFVARTGKPLGLGAEPSGVFLLAPKQELFAWSPRTLRTRQLTDEQGRVTAILPARDQQSVAYVIADKLIREARRPIALRGVTAVVLDLRHLQALGRRMLEGDIRALTIFETAEGFTFMPEVELPGATSFRFERGRWTESRTVAPKDRRAEVRLQPTGVALLPHEADVRGGCPLRLRERVAENGVRSLEVRLAPGSPAPGGRRPVESKSPTRLIGSRENGAALFGLSLP
jgi:hypothetical protein